jgi:CelD/BcsL family acetyltransferase involved in cellulose biosynthesis
MTGSGGISLYEASWERSRVPLKFQVGDIVFGTAVLSLFRRNAQLDERPLHLDETPVPPPRLDGADGFVVWSHPIAARLPVLSMRTDAIRYTPRQYNRYSINLSGDFEQYMASFSGKTRSSLRRKLRKFAEVSGGTIDWKQYRTPEEIAAFFPLAKAVSAKTYQERLLGIGLPADDTFVRSAQATSKRDNVRAYLLFLKGEPISYLYCPISQRVVLYDRLGYDPCYSSLSPGTVLQLLALKALFAEQRFTMFDFTEGEGRHKELFSTGSCLCGDVYVVKRRLATASLVMLHHAVDRTSAAAGMMLDRLNLRSRMRRLVRSV